MRTSGSKKITELTPEEKKRFIDIGSEELSVRDQCLVLGINRSSLYYKPVSISEETIRIMNILDEQYTKTPFYGVRKMVETLNRVGHEVGKEKVQALLRKMGLNAVYSKPRLSVPGKEHKIYPYLLNDIAIIRPNQVWSADITYVRLRRGFAYLMAIIDWYSRYVISWRLSANLTADFCVEALKEALGNGTTEIFNTDQGVQFTSEDFVSCLLEHAIRISMDGKGRAYDNIFIERLWRTIKYEDIYLKGYETIPGTRGGLKQYFNFYNNERLHQALGYKTPAEIHFGRGNVIFQNN